MEISKKKFTVEQISSIKSRWYGDNWPVVYILNNSKEAYVGETSRISSRLKQHLDNTKRMDLTHVNIIADDRFNKSAVLDIESKLIEYMSADDKYKLQNSNAGMRGHDYYEKKEYEAIFRHIWEELRRNKIVQHDLTLLENSDLFKYTPYKTLTEEQYEVAFDICLELLGAMLENRPATFVVNGEAGTGKTVLAMYIMKLLTDGKLIEFVTEDDELIMEQYVSLQQKVEELKICLVVPMTSLRKTLKNVVSKVSGLKSTMVVGPSDVLKDDYDIVIVDETHRLAQRVNLANFAYFDKNNKELGLSNEGTQLDWIMKRSRYQIFFYDSGQSVRPGDIPQDKFEEIKDTSELYITHTIKSQMRSMGGEDYLTYIKDLLNNKPDLEPKTFGDYDFLLFDQVSDMRDLIHLRDSEVGLSRLIAGYAWKWKTQHMSYLQIEQNNAYDIEIQEEKFIWNKSKIGWINSKNAINEVGSIHTTQGYDLNYAGVIIGPELKYNPITQKIYVDKDLYQDTNGKRSILNEDELTDYITQIYRVLLTRSIKGTYLFISDPHLREYFSKFVKLY